MLVQDRLSLAARHIKNRNTIDAAGQERLAASRVAIVGFGGLGERVAEALVRLGVGRLTIIDFDRFDPTNLNRQIFALEDTLSKPKVDVGMRALGRIDSNVHVTPIMNRIDDSNADLLLHDHDVIADCLDSGIPRMVVARSSERLGIPLVHGAIAGWSGRITVLDPAEGSQTERMAFLCAMAGSPISEEERDGAQADHPTGHGVEVFTGNPSFTVCTASALQSAEVAKVILGQDSPLRRALLEFNLLDQSFEQIPFI